MNQKKVQPTAWTRERFFDTHFARCRPPEAAHTPVSLPGLWKGRNGSATGGERALWPDDNQIIPCGSLAPWGRSQRRVGCDCWMVAIYQSMSSKFKHIFWKFSLESSVHCTVHCGEMNWRFNTKGPYFGKTTLTPKKSSQIVIASWDMAVDRFNERQATLRRLQYSRSSF